MIFKCCKKKEIIEITNTYSYNFLKINNLDYFKPQIKYRLYLEYPINTTNFLLIFIHKLNDNKYLGTFISNSNFMSLSFYFQVLEILNIENRCFYKINVQLESLEDSNNLESNIWYIGTNY